MTNTIFVFYIIKCDGYKQMKNTLFHKKIFGTGEEILLPDTRAQSFLFYGKDAFGKLIVISLLCFLFVVPSIVWLYAMNYVRAQQIALLEKATENYLSAYNSIMLTSALKKYLVEIPMVILAFIGFSGGFSIIKRICFNEDSHLVWFFKGIKENALHFGFCGLVFGVSLFFMGFNSVFYTMTGFSPIAKGVLLGLGIVQFLLILIFSMFFCTGTVVYKYTLGQAVKNSVLLTFGNFLKNCGICLLITTPVIAVIFIPSPYQLIPIICGSVFYFGYSVLGMTCYANSIYDKHINPLLGEEYVGRGLNKNAKED